MELVFDGPAQPVGLSVESFLVLLPLAYWIFERFIRKKRSTWLLPTVSLALFALINGIRIWDQLRVRHLDPAEVHVTTGPIDESWHIVSRTRDWSNKSLSYRTTISEGFDVAGLRFKWNIADSYSPATFSNSGSPPIEFVKGTPVEVTWFQDAATDDTRRILRLRIGKLPGSALPDDPAFNRFHRDFVAAFAAGDTVRLTALTRFPFDFAGNGMERDEAESLWMGLLSPGTQSCMATAAPTKNADGSVHLTCYGTVLEFRQQADAAWLFVGIPSTR